jgi:hypothetical protein
LTRFFFALFGDWAGELGSSEDQERLREDCGREKPGGKPGEERGPLPVVPVEGREEEGRALL